MKALPSPHSLPPFSPHGLLQFHGTYCMKMGPPASWNDERGWWVELHVCRGLLPTDSIHRVEAGLPSKACPHGPLRTQNLSSFGTSESSKTSLLLSPSGSPMGVLLCKYHMLTDGAMSNSFPLCFLNFSSRNVKLIKMISCLSRQEN